MPVPSSAPQVSRTLPPPSVWPTGVCVLSGELPPDQGGVADYTARLADALAALGLPVQLLTRRRPGVPTSRHLGAQRVPVSGTIDAWTLRAWPHVRRVLAQLGPRPLLHIQFQAGAYDLGIAVHLLPTLVRATLPRARVITTFHDFLPPHPFRGSGPLGLPANRLLARTSHAAVFSELADLERAGPGVCGRVLPIGSNVDCAPPPDFSRVDVRRALGADDSTFLVGYFGFLNPSKGLPTLVQAVERLAAESSDRPVRLAMIGAETGTSNPEDLAQARTVAELIARSQIASLTVRTGHLEPPALSAHLLACDAIALPFEDGASARRGTLMAALAHGVPTVSTLPPRPSPVGGPRAIWLGAGPGAAALRDGESILLTPPGDPAALAVALARLRDDAALRAHLTAGTQALSERISWPALAKETLGIYASTFGDGQS